MEVHLLKTSDFSTSQYNELAAILEQTPGPINFHFYRSELPFQTSRPGTFKEGQREGKEYDDLFFAGICNTHRTSNKLHPEDLLCLLVPSDHQKDWFLAADPENARNVFIHPAYSDPFIGNDQKYLAAYYLAVYPLLLQCFKRFEVIRKNAHNPPFGCIMDDSKTIEDLRLKLRTGDICEQCMRRIRQSKVNPLLVAQVSGLLNHIKVGMDGESRRRSYFIPSRLLIRPRRRSIQFSDFDKLELSLPPLEMAVYLLYLEYPDGLSRIEFSDKRDELLALYHKMSNQSDLESIQKSIDTLVDLGANSFSERIARINKIFKDQLGAAFAGYYIIHGKRGAKKKVKLDPKLVVYEPSFSVERRYRLTRNDAAEPDHFLKSSFNSIQPPSYLENRNRLPFQKTRATGRLKKPFVLFRAPVFKAQSQERRTWRDQGFRPLYPPFRAEMEEVLAKGKKFALTKLKAQGCIDLEVESTSIAHDALLQVFYIVENPLTDGAESTHKYLDAFPNKAFSQYLKQIIRGAQQVCKRCLFEGCPLGQKNVLRKKG